MAATQEQIDTLNAAIARGEKQVVYNGRSITYRSIEELIAARNDLVGQLAPVTPTVSRQKRLFSRGRGIDGTRFTGWNP